MIERREITDRQEWLAWRRHDITASDIGALFGLSPYKSKLQLWAEKTGQAVEPHETPAMRRGRWLEPAVLEALAERMPNATIDRGTFYLRDPIRRLGGTPDAMADWRVVECKVISRPVFDGWNGELPLAYRLQALVNAMLLDAQGAIVAVMAIDTYDATLELFHVERHADAEAKIIAAVDQFWMDVEAGKMPPADYALDGELIAKLYKPKDAIEPIDLTGDNRLTELLIEREALNATMKAAEERNGAIKTEITEKLGGAPAAICADWRITHKLQHRKETILPATDFTVLRITRKREAAA